jgi:hypothetical protein
VTDDDDGRDDDVAVALARHHHRVGWSALLVFVIAGLVLESLQGLRAGFYVDADVETRRTMFRLAHAHGALLALVNVAFAAGVRSGLLVDLAGATRTSRLLVFGSLTVPVGFFLGGVWFFDGDPGLGIVLVPVGALALVAALFDVLRRS